MPENFINVVDIDAISTKAIQADGGQVRRHGGFCHVFMPVGTRTRKEGRDTLFKLPKGDVIRLSGYVISFED